MEEVGGGGGGAEGGATRGIIRMPFLGRRPLLGGPGTLTMDGAGDVEALEAS